MARMALAAEGPDGRWGAKLGWARRTACDEYILVEQIGRTALNYSAVNGQRASSPVATRIIRTALYAPTLRKTESIYDGHCK